jgi:outer membrane protein OmpA-like peptidoglycan-associated protein/tetratricopeptide (TPR) repeat protein
MKYLFSFALLAAFLFSPGFLTAQPYDATKVNKKAVAFFNEALAKVEDGKGLDALPLLKQALDKEPRYMDAYLLQAVIYSDYKRYDDCIAAYEKAFAIDSVFSFEYRLPYSIALAGQGEFEKALHNINILLSAEKLNPNTRRSGEFRKKSFEFAVNYAKKNINKNYVFAPQNIGDNINSKESEYFPSLTIDNSELVFTRRIRNFNEDFYYSKNKNGSWETSKPMEGDINTPENEGAQNISQDGQWLVFTACNRRDGFGSCDIYISYLTDKGWSEAVNLGGKINSEFWESQPCLSPDKRDLYFASRVPGGYGGSDIYVSHLQPNGKWSDPENMGPGINTPGDEQCPFIHADNQTLYFTSNGHPGYGDADLYYARKGPNGAWSNPVNLGYPINTISQEGTLFISSDGKTAYYSSDRSDSKGGLDIYSFELREDVRPYKTLWVKGQVFDNKTKKGLPSSVELIDLTAKEPLSKVQTDETGNYLITLPVGKDYAFNVNRKGYLFYSDNFSLTQSSPDSVYEKNIGLQPIEVNASVILNNIFFDVNKFDLKPASQIELGRLVQLLTENPSLKIEISGHTDNAGKPADNLALSNNRAKAVVTYLSSKGIAAARLVAKGYGESKPVAANTTEEGRAKNRRTEMKVTGQ